VTNLSWRNCVPCASLRNFSWYPVIVSTDYLSVMEETNVMHHRSFNKTQEA